ncbi:MAG: hemerythrin domain-containing protein [Dermatophilaceae bacterium]
MGWRASPTDRARAAQLAVAWANFQDQLTRHHEGEHDIAWPALQAVGVEAELIGQMDAEHERMAQALSAADTAMAALRQSASARDARSARDAVATLQAVTVEHLDNEEALLEPVYLAKHDDPAIKAMGRQFGREKPAVAGRFFAWLADGATPQERAGIEANVPRPVLAVVGGIYGRGYRREVAPVWR